MRKISHIEEKIYTLPSLLHRVASWRLTGHTIAFTNGCFDILHEGHIYSLMQAAKEADYLIVGVNSDSSIQKLKGKNRPVNSLHARLLVLASLVMVDALISFEEETPLQLITSIKPNVLVKGGDYTFDEVVGAKEVTEMGGQVIMHPLMPGFSTTNIIQKIQTLITS
jgi:D-beta-D-heptose 7-phosphate kinase/D-beta-D-heptose 1-phosphate adenosyltransferase